MTRIAAVAAIAALFCGCAARTWRVTRLGNSVHLRSPDGKPVLTPGRGDASHLDLAPGWRVRVITPILKSGGFQIPSVAKQQGLTVEIDSKGEFLGMETTYYRVEPGVRIKVASVEAMVDGKTERRDKPIAKLFALPNDARLVRLLYLTRVSQSDHDMAVLAARSADDLENLTRRVQADPKSACGTTPYCAWIPPGIAVLAQARLTVDGEDRYVPANAHIREALQRGQQPVAMMRLWRGKPVRVEGTPSDLITLRVADSDIIRTR